MNERRIKKSRRERYEVRDDVEKVDRFDRKRLKGGASPVQGVHFALGGCKR